LPALLQRSSLKLALLFFATFAILIAQDPTSYLTPGVTRVGMRLACRCEGCRNTVGDCPMLHCGSSDPKRHRIFDMQQKGMSDDAIVNQIVAEEGIVALASPPTQGLWPIISWVGPGLALLLGFFVYSRWVRRNQQTPAPLSTVDEATLERHRQQIERELEDETPAK
jgi:cytochrome c-type biogenesis protein CcmH/NrfF